MRLTFIFILFAGCLFSQKQIDDVINVWKADKSLNSATLSFCVVEAASGKVVSEYNSHTFVMPASTLKAVTTSAALGILGKFYRYETKIYASGKYSAATGILNGDIIIKGCGDPTLNSELYKTKKDTSEVTDKWADVLKQKGFKQINGKIIGDATTYERQIPSNWIWGDISNYFGAAPCGLSFNDNLYNIVFSTGDQGTKAKIIDVYPKYKFLALEHDDDVIASGKDDDAYVTGDPFGNKKLVKGTVPPNRKEIEVKAVLPDPALLCAEFMQNSLNKAGLKTRDTAALSIYDPQDPILNNRRSLIYTSYSSSLEKIVYYTNLTSNNLFCETILKTLGDGSNYNGIDKVKEYWKSKGLDVSELYMVDGNGLSRANTVTTSFEANLLQKIYNDSTIFKSFYNSLPVAGLSGSMRNVGAGTFLDRNMRAKTGYINRARGYCGYVKTRSGKDLCFSVLFNNYNCSPKEAKNKIELLLLALAEL